MTLNALTIDVEDYFQVNAFARNIGRDRWEQFPLRVADNTYRILEMLDDFGIKATFFILGWVAEKEPELIKAIQRKGHEIACHGYGHELIYEIGPERFREDIRRSKGVIEQLTGSPVAGYRAPSYSITGKSLWALDILIEEGFAYDSSIFPVYHDTYGVPDAPRFPYLITREAGSIKEFPLTTYPIRFGKREYRIPVAGGGYLRLFPASFLVRAIRSINIKESQTAVLYFHPWEIDSEQPRIKTGWRSRTRHYLNLRRTERKLQHIFSCLKFAPMNEVLAECRLGN